MMLLILFLSNFHIIIIIRGLSCLVFCFSFYCHIYQIICMYNLNNKLIIINWSTFKLMKQKTCIQFKSPDFLSCSCWIHNSNTVIIISLNFLYGSAMKPCIPEELYTPHLFVNSVSVGFSCRRSLTLWFRW